MRVLELEVKVYLIVGTMGRVYNFEKFCAKFIISMVSIDYIILEIYSFINISWS